MKKKQIIILASVVVAAGIGYHFYKQKKERDAVEEAKKKALASNGTTAPSVATPGIAPTGVTGAPVSKPINNIVVGDGVMQTM